ncbi:MAG TPA: aldo/keto reductase [Longimicrobiaceae bacterium]
MIATKGGVTRPGGQWGRDGSPAHLRQACDESLRALGVERVDLYQLHAPDPRVPFEESVGACAGLLREGKVAAVGLSNVSLEQIRAAETIVPITSVQNRYSPWDRGPEETGIIRYCDENHITFLPYSPVGGRRKVQLLRENAELRRIGERLGATPEELVLAWVLGASPSVVAIPGASRAESIESSVRAGGLRLDGETRAELEAAFRSLPD